MKITVKKIKKHKIIILDDTEEYSNYLIKDLNLKFKEFFENKKDYHVLDLSKLTYLNSTILNSILYCKKFALENNFKDINIIAPNYSLLKTLEIANINKVIGVYSSYEDLPNI